MRVTTAGFVAAERTRGFFIFQPARVLLTGAYFQINTGERTHCSECHYTSESPERDARKRNNSKNVIQLFVWL